MDGILAPLRVDLGLMRKHFEGGKPSRASCRTRVNKVLQQIEYLQAFLNDMRTYARAEEGKRNRVVICDLAQRALTLAREGFQAAGLDTGAVTVVVEAPETLRAPIYPRQTTTALMHLIRSGQHLRPDGSRARSSGGWRGLTALPPGRTGSPRWR